MFGGAGNWPTKPKDPRDVCGTVATAGRQGRQAAELLTTKAVPINGVHIAICNSRKNEKAAKLQTAPGHGGGGGGGGGLGKGAASIPLKTKRTGRAAAHYSNASSNRALAPQLGLG